MEFLVILVIVFIIGLIAVANSGKPKANPHNKSKNSNYSATTSSPAYFAGPDSSNDCGSSDGGFSGGDGGSCGGGGD
ncbi:hypothetical protein BAMA_23365 [Bacillus manliponensis]|uniref:Methanol dehydrogenase n=1 Tax=Bacillus manliponensis TaxID=574376 RepID=A0A073JYN6_9BACI|nr:hypothetical protein [Bacillus manliponensis]KEK19317.1 hypothetical protein BAMA_23365 [Bacillus manliponensis]